MEEENEESPDGQRPLEIATKDMISNTQHVELTNNNNNNTDDVIAKDKKEEEEDFWGDDDFDDDDLLKVDVSDVSNSTHEQEHQTNTSLKSPESVSMRNHSESSTTDSLNDVQLFDLTSIAQPTSEHLDVLKATFGFSNFRSTQWEIIRAVIEERKDVCLVMATGAGKSLCYQFPPVFKKGVCVVVCPLISLMEDQVHALNSSNIPAGYLGSAQTNSATIKNDVLRGKLNLVYVTPEYLCASQNFLKELNEKTNLVCVAIDEAHCVSQWGYDFRTSYQQLSFIKKVVPDVPLLALTATATPRVRKDICTNLNLYRPLEKCTSFDRENLYMEVQRKSSIYMDLKPLLSKDKNAQMRFTGSTIIYCPTKKKTSEVMDVLISFGVKCAIYHAGLALATRKECYRKFMSDEIDCIIATVAFGMGIDKPDIRTVIHYGAPKDIESYYQEIGRAGRDGNPSNCITFFNAADFGLSRHFIAEISDTTFKTYKVEMLAKLEKFLTTTGCRRKTILKHFENVGSSCGGHKDCCDNCRKKELSKKSKAVGSKTPVKDKEEEDEYDVGKECVKLLNAVKATGNGRFGITVPILLLKASTSQKISHLKYTDMYGAGKDKTERYWKALGREILIKGFLEEQPIANSFGSTVKVSAKGQKWLTQQSKKSEPKLMLSNPSLDLVTEINGRLAPDRASPYTAAKLTERVLRKQPRVAPWKKHVALMSSILQGAQRCGTPFDGVSLQRSEGPVERLTETQSASYVLHKDGQTLDEIAKRRALVHDTIYGHICSALLAGFPVHLKLVDLTFDDVALVVKTMNSENISYNISQLRPIKDKLPASIGFGKLKFVLAMLEVHFGVEGEDPPQQPNQEALQNIIDSAMQASQTANSQNLASSNNNNGAKRKVPGWLEAKMGSSQKPSYKRSSSKKQRSGFL
ncbi:bifunctional 3'-5' exonuclease/ATP-dependent helicase WRN-like [Clytia hemisphaerica]